MPGIAGYGHAAKVDVIPMKERLARMAEPMHYHPRQSVTLDASDRCGLALVEYGEGFEFQKSGFARRDGVTVIMDGEVFPDHSEVPPELRHGGAEVQRAEYCLERYLSEGVSFISNLNGVFGIAVIDDRSGEVHVANDRFGHHLMFVWERNHTFAFASSLRSLLAADDGIGVRIDDKAVAELIVYERLLGDRTLFPDVKRLPAGSVATWSGQRWNSSRYFEPKRRAPDPKLRNWRDGAAELVRRLRRSQEKRASDSAPTGLFLSGGLDSRLVLGCSPVPVKGLTFSFPGLVAREAAVAKRIADAAGIPLVMLERGEDYYAQVARRAVEANEGICTFVGCHSIGLHQRMYDEGVRVAMTGDRSDVAFKDYFATCIDRKGLDPWTGSQAQIDSAVDRLMESGMIRKKEHRGLMISALSPELKSRFVEVEDDTRKWLRDILSAGEELDEILSEMALCDWQAQTALAMLRGISTEFVERSPFFDNDVWDLAMELPISWRADARIVKRAITLAAPALGRIEDVSTRFAPSVPRSITTLAECGKGAMKHGRDVLRRTLGMLGKQPGVVATVFAHSGFHNRDAALLRSAEYRRLVEGSISDLPSRLFDRDRIGSVLKADLNSDRPASGKLFEILISFSEFSKLRSDLARCSTDNGGMMVEDSIVV